MLARILPCWMGLIVLEVRLNKPRLKISIKQVELTKKITEQVRQLAKEEDEKLADARPYDVMLPYDQATTLSKNNIDVGPIATGLPCGSEEFLLMRYDLTQTLDVYGSCKYDLLHNSHLNLEGLDELFKSSALVLKELPFHSIVTCRWYHP